MLYAVIADVHGNYPALQAVLEDAHRAGADRFLLTGDYITDLPYTRAVYEALLRLPGAVIVSGNREAYMRSLNPALRGREQFGALFCVQEELGEEGCRWALSLPESTRITTPDGQKTLYMEHMCRELYGGDLHCEGTFSPGTLRHLYPDRGATRAEVTAFVQPFFHNMQALRARAQADVIIHAHNHMQYAVEADGVLYVNPGSCGLPADHAAGAPYTLLRYEDGAFTVIERRVPYDMRQTAQALRASGMYRAAATWCEVVIQLLLTARDYNHEFFAFLKEEQEKPRPETDAEHNAALRRAFARMQALIAQEKGT